MKALGSPLALVRRPITASSVLERFAPTLSHDAAIIREASVRAANAVGSLPRQASIFQTTTKPNPLTLVERLHDARASYKVKTNNFAMHFGRDWQQRFFAQLDAIMDAEEWDVDDPIITDAAFTTLLRILLILRGKRRPGLGVGPNGSVVAAWTNGPNRLTFECRPDDEVRWIVSVIIDGKPDTAVGQTTLSFLFDRLQSYNPEQWFDDEGRQSTR